MNGKKPPMDYRKAKKLETPLLLSGALLSRRRQRFSALAAALDAMSPLKVLGRGYAVARSRDGTILKSGREVAPGDRVSVTLSEGGFDAVVERSYTKEDQT